MSDMYIAGKRNLLILSWIGLGSQAVGVAAAVLSFAASAGLPAPGPDNTLGPILMVVFGMALGGWAGNLREVVKLKERVTALEASPDIQYREDRSTRTPSADLTPG